MLVDLAAKGGGLDGNDESLPPGDVHAPAAKCGSMLATAMIWVRTEDLENDLLMAVGIEVFLVADFAGVLEGGDTPSICVPTGGTAILHHLERG